MTRGAGMKFVIGTNEIIRELSGNKRFICFGSGILLKALCQNTGITEFIDAIADNNDALWGTTAEIDGIKIIHINPKEIKNLLTDRHVLLITTTYYKQLQEQLSKELSLNAELAYYFPSAEDMRFEEYAKGHAEEPLKDLIVFRSGLAKYVEGFDFSDNAKALFEYMLDRGYHKKYKLLWMVKEPDGYSEYSDINNVEFISYDWEYEDNKELSDRYFDAIYFAKYFFFTDSHFWLRNCRNGQVRINLWHGCGFKDRKTKNGPCGKNYDFMTVNSDTYADIHAVEFGCSREQMLVTGLAKQDWLFQGLSSPINEFLEIPKTDKYIFWLPTFRMAVDGLERLNEYILESETGLPVVTTEAAMNKLDIILETLNISLIIKLHPVQDNSLISHKKYNKIFVLDNKTLTSMDYHINSLLSQADAIISDYSSVAVDFLLTDKPIGFLLDDVEEYEMSRGFVFHPIKNYLPGEKIYNFEQLTEFIREISLGLDSSKTLRHSLMKIFHAYRDGNNCERILQQIGIEK
jgi:CDP-glycerol glycerophosphotransferase (TagB/SpsB family)